MDLCLIISVSPQIIPELTDDNLFEFFKPRLIEELVNPDVIFMGVAPDNTADNQDELLLDGYFIRIICPESFVELKVESFLELIKSKNPKWSKVIIEEGFIKTETTIEFLYSL